jgi:uncharacterized protein with FMN-binding domain
MRKAWMGTFVAVLVFAIFGCAFMEEINKLSVAEINISAIKDGVYEGEQMNSPVTAKVRATVNGGILTDIVLLEHSHGPNHGADAIIPQVIAKQSLAVDAVSGSTYSSKVVLKAIENALVNGKM